MSVKKGVNMSDIIAVLLIVGLVIFVLKPEYLNVAKEWCKKTFKDKITITVNKTENIEITKTDYPQYIVMPEDGFDVIHRGASYLHFQQNIAKFEAERLKKPMLVFVAIEKWNPNGSMEAVEKDSKKRNY